MKALPTTPIYMTLFLAPPRSRGLHSFTFQLNVSALYGIGGARRGCVARMKGVLGVD